MPVRRFQSDLDFVIDVRNRAFFETFVRRWPLTTNSFGGYSLALGTLKVDFWDIERTWARVKRLRDVSCLEDVLETTFFNIDALMFVVSDGRFVEREGALSAIREKRLSINLKDNPNPLGATVRTLRRMYQFDLCLSEELAEFVAEGIDHFGWSAVVQRDFEAYPLRPIAHAIFGEAPRDGREFLETLTACEYRLPGSQMELPFRTAS